MIKGISHEDGNSLLDDNFIKPKTSQEALESNSVEESIMSELRELLGLEGDTENSTGRVDTNGSYFLDTENSSGLWNFDDMPMPGATY